MCKYFFWCREELLALLLQRNGSLVLLSRPALLFSAFRVSLGLEGELCGRVGGSRQCVRHSSEHGLGPCFEDGAEEEALKLGKPRRSSHFNSYMSCYEQKSCYVPSVPFFPASS